MKRFLKFGLCLLLALLALGFLLTSSPVLTGVVLPLCQTSRVRLGAERCSLGLFGASLRDLHLDILDSDGHTNLTLYVQAARAAYSPAGLLRRLPGISEVEVANPRVVLYEDGLEREAKEIRREAVLSDFDLKDSLGRLAVPLSLDRLVISGASLAYSRPDRKLWFSGSGEATGFGPRRTLEAWALGNLRYAAAEDVSIERLPLDFSASVKLGDTLVPETARASLTATNVVGRAGGLDLADWHITGGLAAASEAEGHALAVSDLTLSVRNRGQEVTTFQAAGRADFVKGDVQAATVVETLPSDLWQRLFGRSLPVPLALDRLESQVRGGLFWSGEDRCLSFTGRTFFRNLAYSDAPELPALSGAGCCTGSYEVATAGLRLEYADLAASRPDGRSMVAVRTLVPLALRTGGRFSPEELWASLAYDVDEAELLWLAPFLRKRAEIHGGALTVRGRTSYDPILETAFGGVQCALFNADFEVGGRRYRGLTGEGRLEGSLAAGTNAVFNLETLRAVLGSRPLIDLALRGEGDPKARRGRVAFNVNSASSLLWDPQGEEEEIIGLGASGRAVLDYPRVSLSPTEVRVQRGSGALQRLSLSGDFCLEPEKGSQDFALTADSLDLSAFLGKARAPQVTAMEEAAVPAEPPADSRPAKALPVAGWRARGRISCGRLSFGNWTLSPCRCEAVLSNGLLRAETSQAGFCQGGIRALFQAALSAPGRPYFLQGEGTNIACSAVLASLSRAGGEAFSGTAVASYEQRGVMGPGARDFTAALTAQVREGAFRHVKILEQLGGILHYDDLSCFDFDTCDLQGVITNRTLRILEGEAKSDVLGLKAHGDIGFDTRVNLSIGLTLSPRAVGAILKKTAPRTSLDQALDVSYRLPPVIVTGTLSQPVFAGRENILRSVFECLGDNWQLILDVIPTDTIKEQLQKGMEQLGGAYQSGRNSKAAQTADKLIREGKNKLMKIFGHDSKEKQ